MFSNTATIEEELIASYLLNQTNTGYQLLNEHYEFILVNNQWSKLLGYQNQEVIGRNFFDFLTEESQVLFTSILSNLKTVKTISNLQLHVINKSGGTIPVRLDAHQYTSNHQQALQTHCTIQIQSGIQHNSFKESDFNYIFENSLHEIYMFDAVNLNFIKASQGALSNIGYSESELKLLTPLDIKPELTQSDFNNFLNPLQSYKKSIVRFETIHQRKNGTTYPVNVNVQRISIFSTPAYVAIILDISQQKEIENRLNLVIQGSELGYWDWDYVTGNHKVNDRWLEMLGLSRDDLENYVSDWDSRIHPDDKQRVRTTVQNSIDKKIPYSIEFRMQHKQGFWVWIQGSGAVVQYDTDNKSAIRLCGTHQDISSRKKNDLQLKKLSQAVEQSPNLTIITNIEGEIEYSNPKIIELTKYQPSEVVGQNMSIFSSGETNKETYQSLWQTINSGKEWRGILCNKKKSGELFWTKESIAPIKDENHQITHFISIQEDITDAKHTSEKLLYQATHDPLTELLNRREFEKRVAEIIADSKINHSNHVLCFLDLDQFKIINDTCTHMAGDELLKQFANLLQLNFRPVDLIGRMGGDEFAVILTNCSIEQAEQMAEKILASVHDYQFSWDNKRFRIRVSIGLVKLDDQAEDLSSLLRHADIACYSAKHKGGHKIHIFKDSDHGLELGHKELQWISHINHALNEDLFSLFIQPIYPLNQDVVSPDHYEVLIRLHDNNGDLIPLSSFLPAVERFNLSLQLDQWVINAVFFWINKNSKQNKDLPCLSINLSGQNFGNKQLLAYIKKQHQINPGINASKICFEITETAAINNLSEASLFISELKTYGFKFSLDDFGSGLSSFEYLKHLPVDYLKIDGQFIRDLLADPIDYALVKAINEIGHIMNKKTIAEYVENGKTMEKLKELDVDYVQGFFLGQPQPLSELLQ